MYPLICNKRGISLIEVLVSLVLLVIGVLGVLTLMPNSMRLSGRSDFMGKASGVLLNQLHSYEARILNPNASLPVSGTATVYPSGQSTQMAGDTPFTVQATVTSLGGNAYLVTIRVTWQGNATGISESLRVVRQENWRS